MRRTLSLLATGLVLAACANVSPGSTIPPINIPSITIPSIPPINIPSITIPSIPPIDIPTIAPANPGTGLCRLITPAEVGAALGTQVTVNESSDTSCTYFSAQTFASVNIRTEANDLATARLLLTNPRDVTIGSYPAVIGGFMGILMYVQRGGEVLVVQGVLLEDNADNQQRIIQIGTTAASRW